jgi:hypothetical protein
MDLTSLMTLLQLIKDANDQGFLHIWFPSGPLATNNFLCFQHPEFQIELSTM